MELKLYPEILLQMCSQQWSSIQPLESWPTDVKLTLIFTNNQLVEPLNVLSEAFALMC